MIVTVTLNAAIDRTLVVPNFQPGQRHRASVGFPSAGGKGINIARALKQLGAPVVCTGLAGGRTGTLFVEELTNEGILNDFVRIKHESRTSIAVLDPTSNAYTEINEWGPEVSEEELDILREKLAYLAQGAEFVVLAGSLPRGVDPGFYGELVRALNRDQLLAVVDTEGEPLRLAVEAEPYLVSPNQQRSRGARRSRVRRRGGPRCRAGRDRRPRRAERSHHARDRLLRAAARGPHGRCASVPRLRASSRPRSSAPGTRCWPASSPPAWPGGRSRTPCARPSRPGRPPCSRRAPDASTSARRPAWRRSSSSSTSSTWPRKARTAASPLGTIARR